MSDTSQAIENAVVPAQSSPARTLDGDTMEALLRCVDFDPNDLGNARRLKEHFGNDILYVRDVGFHVYAGTHWSNTGADEAVALYA